MDKIRTETVEIVDFRVVDFLARMNGLRQAAKRIGAHFEVRVLEDEALYKEWALDPYLPMLKQHLRFIPIRLEYEDLRIEGWHIAAKIEHTPAGNIVKVLPEEEVEPAWRVAGANCDHCGHKRSRKVTYILQHADGQIQQVGSTCLGDFLGHPNPEDYESYFNFLESLKDTGPEDDDPVFGGGHIYIPAEAILATTYFVASTEGWTSKTAARQYGTGATADRVLDLLLHNDLNTEQERKEMGKRADELTAKAKEIIRYVVELAESTPMLQRSDYIHNLYTAIQNGHIDYQNFGLVASAFAVWNRAQEEKQKDQGPEIVPGYFGEPKERITVRLQSLATYSYTANYGYNPQPVFINKFRTEDGKLAVWKTSTEDFSGEAGKWFEGKATVKAHERYRGEDQTLLTRCRLEEAS